MENRKRLDQLIEDNFILPDELNEFLVNYFGDIRDVRWFYFDFDGDIPVIDSSSEEIEIKVKHIEYRAQVTIELVGKAISNVIDYGCLTTDLIAQAKTRRYGSNNDGPLADGIALSIGVRDREICILFHQYIKRNREIVFLDDDGPGGDNLTPTSIPPGR